MKKEDFLEEGNICLILEDDKDVYLVDPALKSLLGSPWWFLTGTYAIAEGYWRSRIFLILLNSEEAEWPIDDQNALLASCRERACVSNECHCGNVWLWIVGSDLPIKMPTNKELGHSISIKA
ncbi:hypothetical protein TREES_T100001525 [Tupaia chinensis]|uniref:Uncharacterized protein n=1 Tax=Tupaia chinensis TaxID=246437 RepID=L9KPB4_TUPCH|nr:hypothetical protein TREES_T100001525 [Tupaia chinensis]